MRTTNRSSPPPDRPDRVASHNSTRSRTTFPAVGACRSDPKLVCRVTHIDMSHTTSNPPPTSSTPQPTTESLVAAGDFTTQPTDGLLHYTRQSDLSGVQRMMALLLDPVSKSTGGVLSSPGTSTTELPLPTRTVDSQHTAATVFEAIQPALLLALDGSHYAIFLYLADFGVSVEVIERVMKLDKWFLLRRVIQRAGKGVLRRGQVTQLAALVYVVARYSYMNRVADMYADIDLGTDTEHVRTILLAGLRGAAEAHDNAMLDYILLLLTREGLDRPSLVAEAICLGTAYHGHLAWVEEYIYLLSDETLARVLGVAGARGHLEFIQQVVTMRETLDGGRPSALIASINCALAEAARHGHLAIVQEYWPSSQHIDGEVINSAFEGQHLAVVQYLIPPGKALDTCTVCLALESSAEIAEYVLTTQTNLDWVVLLEAASEEGLVSAVDYLLHHHSYSLVEVNRARQCAAWDDGKGQPRPDNEPAIRLLGQWRDGPLGQELAKSDC
jgi:hypothetical protein